MARSNKAKARKGSKNTHAGPKQSHLSMQQEAKNTEVRNLWRMNLQLRHQTVKFVSAGNIQPAQELNLELKVEEHSGSEETPPIEWGNDSTTDTARGDTLDPDIASRDTVLMSPALPVRPHSRTPEDSSEDEIVFRGRRRTKGSNTRFGFQKALVDGDGLDDWSSTNIPKPIASIDVLSDRVSLTASEEEYHSWIRIGGHDPVRSPRTTDEDDILADYIANMDDGSEDEASSTSDEERSSDNRDGDDCTTRTEKMISEHSALDSRCEDTQLDHSNMSPTEVLGEKPSYISSAWSQSAGTKPERSIFASTTAFADALELDPYYGFDVMDFSRPSLRKKEKKEREHLAFDALDSDLETELIDAWSNDRLKKKSKKKEREELRAQGLLGRRKNDPDLKTKYADGISIEELKSEIRLFLLSPKNSLSLPPMSKHRRMLIHDMAHALRLTSQSRGKGSSRFPILSKTSRTTKYTHKTISQIDRVFTKERFNPRSLKAWDKPSGRPAKAKRGHSNVSYMDGDVVGGSAPEIGVENRGRAMLEKMGWSTGTALGATNNKGILLPVAHVVKNSKAGLG
ncbi:hypothetical protein BDV12DRAFT_73556 [Aspergillus spectabilis]